MATIASAFNEHVLEFFADIRRVAPDDKDIIAAEMAVAAARKANATLFMRSWTKYTQPYLAQISSKDTAFFLAKDYSTDVASGGGSSSLVEAIDRVRSRVASMTQEEKEKIVGYIYTLTMLASMKGASH